MRQYRPRNLQPNQNQFFAFVKDRLSPQGQESLTFNAVWHLFKLADDLYRTLDFYTKDRELTAIQEHDLVALTAHYVLAFDLEATRRIIQMDATLSESDRPVLIMALELFQTSAAASTAALGNPVWVEPS